MKAKGRIRERQNELRGRWDMRRRGREGKQASSKEKLLEIQSN